MDSVFEDEKKNRVSSSIDRVFFLRMVGKQEDRYYLKSSCIDIKKLLSFCIGVQVDLYYGTIFENASSSFAL